MSCYNHPARGDYNTEALIFKKETARFLDVGLGKFSVCNSKLRRGGGGVVPQFHYFGL